MSEVTVLRQRLRRTREALVAALSGLADADLERPWPWRGGTKDVRYALLRVAGAARLGQERGDQRPLLIG